MIPGMLSAFICFLLFLGTLILWFHLQPRVHRFAAMAVVWSFLSIIYIPIYLQIQHILPSGLSVAAPLASFQGIVNLINGIVIFTLLYLNFGALYTSDHGLSLAFMFELEGRDSKRMTLDELKNRFPYDKMLKDRLKDMQTNGFVVSDANGFKLASKGKFFVFVLGGLKRFLKLEPGG